MCFLTWPLSSRDSIWAGLMSKYSRRRLEPSASRRASRRHFRDGALPQFLQISERQQVLFFGGHQVGTVDANKGLAPAHRVAGGVDIEAFHPAVTLVLIWRESSSKVTRPTVEDDVQGPDFDLAVRNHHGWRRERGDGAGGGGRPALRRVNRDQVDAAGGLSRFTRT